MIAQLLSGMRGDIGALLILLLVGHVFGDFLLQTEWIATNKERRWNVLLGHAGLVFVAHLAVLWPFMSGPVFLGVLALAALHFVFDAARIRAFGSWGASLAAFFVDQALHVLVAVALWGWLQKRSGSLTAAWCPAEEWLAWYARWMAVAAAYVFNGRGGTRIVRGILEWFPKVGPTNEDGEGSSYAMGRTIGCLERYLALTLVFFNQWAALGFILAAKSLARFPEFRDPEHKDFAEYYLIGTLTSILVALASGIFVRLVVL